MTLKLRIVLIGPAQSGKTNYLKILQGEGLPSSYTTTPGQQLHFIDVELNKRNYNLTLWEIGSTIPRSGETRKEILDSQLKLADAVLVFCDLSNPESLTKIATEFSAKKLKIKCKPTTRFTLVGRNIKPELSPVICDETLVNFAIRQGFDHWNTSTDSPLFSLRSCIHDLLENRRERLKAEVEGYRCQRHGEVLKTLIAYLAWVLGLSYFFGHSKEEDKMAAADALYAALSHIDHHLTRLTPPQKRCFNNGRLSRLYEAAKPYIETDESGESNLTKRLGD